MTLAFVHQRVAVSVFLFALILGSWGMVLYFLRRGMSGSYWGALAAAEALILVEVVLGLWLWLTGARPAEWIHWIYASVGVLTLPAYFRLSHGHDDRRTALTYGFLCIFLAGVFLRAAATGG